MTSYINVGYGEVNTNFTPQQTKQIQQIVHDYLVTNPQVLIEASQVLQQQTAAKMAQQAKTAAAQYNKELFHNPTDPIIGNTKGNIALVEFMDYQCGHCKEMGNIITSLSNKNPQLRIIIKELPIFGANSQYAAKAALIAQKHGKYLELHNALLTATNPLTVDEVNKIAASVGLNIDKLTAEMKDQDQTLSQQLKDNFKLAQALGLAGTPAFLVSNSDGSKAEFMPGAANEQQLQTMVEQIKAKK